MPLRVLGLICQLGLSPDRVLIEICGDRQSIVGVLQVSEQRRAILIEKLRSMVLVWGATLQECAKMPGCPEQVESENQL